MKTTQTRTKTKSLNTLKTTLHHYYFDTSKPEQKAQWEALRKKLKASNPKQHHAWGGEPPKLRNDSEEVEIETECVFDNQWNTTTTRVFDWFLNYELQAKHIKRGHWLELTPELIAVREQTLKCGYCGKHFGPHHAPAPANGFCDACLDSSYLKQGELHLLRLYPLSYTPKTRPELTEAEKAELLPLYVARQTTGTDSRAKAARDKQRADVIEKAEKDIRDATTERDGMLRLWDLGLSLDNVMFYSHTGIFSFGWRRPVSAEVKSKLLHVLSEFDFPYEIKSENGNVSTHS